MTPFNQDWQFLSLKFDKDLKEVMMQHYFAAQYIALIGRHLIPQREDDSNTSMNFDWERQRLMGEKLKGGKRLAFHMDDLTIRYTEKNSAAFHGLSLDGLTREQSFQGIKQMLDEHGVDTGALIDELHYDLPDHPLLHGSRFNAGESHLIFENISFRHNAEVILRNILVNYPEAEPVRIWPHHFDTGSVIPVSFDKKGNLMGSLGLGWAIPDGMIDEPYFYLSIWTKEPLEIPDDLPALASGQWVKTAWNGAVLRLSELHHFSTKEGQYKTTVSFFETSLKTAMEILKL